jgi:hypothetical protein
MRERIRRIQQMRILISTGCLLNTGYVDEAGCFVRAVSPGLNADKQYPDEQQDDCYYDG